MGVAIFRGQRVPMLDASTLEDRTRPVVEPVSWLARRLRAVHVSDWPRRIDRSPGADLEPWVLYPGDPRYFGAH